MTTSPSFTHSVGDNSVLASKLRALVGEIPTTLTARTTPPNAGQRHTRRRSATRNTSRKRSRFQPASQHTGPKPVHNVPERRCAPVVASARTTLAASLDLADEMAKVRSALDPRIAEHMQGRGYTKAEFWVIAALIVTIDHPRMLVESDVHNWPLLAWHTSIKREGLNADVGYARRELDRTACLARNLWLDSRDTIRGRCDESLHPELSAGYSTGAGVTGGE